MNNKTVCRFAVWFLLLPFIQAIPAVAQGDSVMAQVADGTGADGTQFITKFRITHLTPDTGTEFDKFSAPLLMAFVTRCQGEPTGIDPGPQASRSQRIQSL